MIDFIYHMAFVCLSGAAIGIFFLTIAGICKLINFLTKGKLEDILVNLIDE